MDNLDTATDQQLATAASAGNQAAATLLFARSRNTVRAVLRKTLKHESAEGLEDAEQDANVKIWRYIDSFDGSRAAWSTWCYKIAENVAKDIIKARMSSRRPVLVFTDCSEELERVADEAPSEERKLESRQELITVMRGLAAELGPALAQALILRAGGHSGRQIEALINIDRRTMYRNLKTKNISNSPDEKV